MSAAAGVRLRAVPGRLRRGPDGGVVLTGVAGETPVFGAGSAASARFDLLVDGVDPEDWEDALLDAGGVEDLAAWEHVAGLLERAGALGVGLVDAAGRPVVEVRAIAPGDGPEVRLADLPPATGRFRLDRFVVVTPRGAGLVAESPRSVHRVLLEPAGAQALARLAGGAEPGDLGLDAAAGGVLVSWLEAIGLVGREPASVVPGDAGGPHTRAVPTDWDLWEPHDLAFHWRSRRGGHDAVSGATFRFEGALPPLPAVRPRHAGPVVALSRAGDGADPGLWRVLAERHSTRTYGEPLDVGALGALLDRALSVWEVLPVDEAAGRSYEQTRRPYPGGGRSHELEVYLTTRGLDGLPSGVWHYDPLAHDLTCVTDAAEAVDALLADATVSSAGFEPQVLVTLTSRHGRNAWKYEGMAYRLALLDAGVVYHQLYLVATALGVGICGLGNGDATLVTRYLGLDPAAEVSIAEIMLGSVP